MNATDLEMLRAFEAEFEQPGLERVRQFLRYVSGQESVPATDPLQESTRLYFPGLAASAWHDVAGFPWAPRVESASAEIKAELAELLGPQGARFSPYEDPHTKELGWKGWDTYPLYAAGKPFSRSVARCPRTMEVLRSVPHGSRQGMFSRLTPGAHLEPHTGGANLVLTCHLGLIVPDGCGIRVGNEVRSWEEGKVLVFDDSFIHEAWNRGSSPRVVLIWDVWHPGLAPEEISAIVRLSKAFGRKI